VPTYTNLDGFAKDVHELNLTPKALANFSPGFERSENPGIAGNNVLNPEGVSS